MAIKSLRIKRRLHNLASARTTEVAVAEFRSLEEIKEYLKHLAAELVDYEKRVKLLKDLFLKMNAARRVNKQKPETAAGFTFDSSKVPEMLDKYGGGVLEKPSQDMLKVFDPGIVTDDKKVPVKIQPHDYQAIRKNFMGVEDWEKKLESLKVINALLLTDFKGVPGSGAVVKLLNTLKARIEKSNAQAYKFLEKHAKQLAPVMFTEIVDNTVEKLEENYGDQFFEGIEVKTYLTADERVVKVQKGKKTVDDIRYNLKFVTYVKLENLQDESGSISDEAYLIYLAQVDMDKMMMTMYVTFANQFVSPMRVIYGRRVFHNDESCWKQTLAIMSSVFGLKKITQQSWPQTPKKMREYIGTTQYGQYVDDVRVEDEELIIRFNKSVKNERTAEQIGDKIRQEIQLMVIGLVKKSITTQFRVEQPESDVWQAVISLNAPVGYVRDEKIERKMFDRLHRMGIPLTEEDIRFFILRKNY